MAERVYTCLACAERPVFGSKVEAYGHARSEHRALLEHAHVDELFETHDGVVIPVEAEDDGPWVCLHPDCRRHERFIDTMKAHISNGHNVVRYAQIRGVDYASEAEALAIQTARRREADVQTTVFRRRMQSVRGVTDFLTECGEWGDAAA